MGYWSIGELAWDAINISDGPELFLARTSRSQRVAMAIFAEVARLVPNCTTSLPSADTDVLLGSVSVNP
jgi:hypothetical protein